MLKPYVTATMPKGRAVMTMNYSENNTGTAPATPATPKLGESLRVWVAFAILIGGFVITVLKDLDGTS